MPRAFAIKDTPLDPVKKRKLQRFLDVTRSAPFFAKMILMVEGSAERPLLSAMAGFLDIVLRKLSVTLVSVEGLNFDWFLSLFGNNGMPVRVPHFVTLSEGARRYRICVQAELFQPDSCRLRNGIQ